MLHMILAYDFSISNNLYLKKMLIDDAEMKQNKSDAKLNALNRYSPKKQNILRQKISF